MSEPPLPPPLPPLPPYGMPAPPSSPLVRSELPTNLVRNRIELLQAAEEVFRKYGELIPMMHEYLKQILYLGRNINRFVMDLESPEQAIWSSKHKNMFDPVFPVIERYEPFLGVLIKIMVLDQTTIYTHDLLMHLMVLLIGEELVQRGMYSDRYVEQIGKTFMYLLDIIREFFRRRNICLNVLSDSLTIDPRLLEASKYRGSVTFLIQFVAVDEMNEDQTWRAMHILAEQELHVTNLLKAEAEHRVMGAPTVESKAQAQHEAVKYIELSKRLDEFIKTLHEEMAENTKVKELKAKRNSMAAKMKKDAANAAKAEAERAAAAAEAELLKEEAAAAAAAAGKAEKEKRKREEKAAKKAAEKAEADRIAAEKAAAAAAEKAEANRLAAEKKSVKNSVKKSSNLLAASMKKRAPELMTSPRALLPMLKKPSASPSAPSPPAPSPSSLPPSVSPASSTPNLRLPPAPPPSVLPPPPSTSPPNFSNTPRAPTPSLAKIGFTPYSRSPPVTRFWETLDHRYIYQILHDIFMNTQNPNTRFYLKGSAAVHMYKRAHRTTISNHTSDYDTTLLINPGLGKKQFYELRSYMLNSIIQRLTVGMNDPRFNAELITKLYGADIPFASSYWDATIGKTIYEVKDTIPQEHVGVPDKSGPRFYTDTMNQYPYASHAAKPSTNILNMRIIRTLVKPKNVTVLQLYTKTSPEIKLIEVTVPFYEYDENETQISLAAQWSAAAQVNVIDGVPVLSLPALKAEQQKLRTLKEAAEIDRRLADINMLIGVASGSGSGSARKRTRKLRR